MARLFSYPNCGKYIIPLEILVDHPGIAHLVYSQGIILHADWAEHYFAVDYIACSRWFRELEDGELVPTYVWEIDGTAMKVVSCKEKSLDQERNPRYFYL